MSNPVFKNDYNIEMLEKVTPLHDDFSMYVTPRFTGHYTKGYERFSTRLVKNFITNCDLFVDVGANFGYYSLLVGNVNQTTRIIAVEPIKEIFNVLNKNFLHNNIGAKRARCINAAVTSVSGKVRFYKSEAADNSSVLPHPNSDTLEELESDAISLDDVLKNEQYKSLFVKTDTDGNELEVLKGMSSTFDKCDDIVILLEINPKMLRLAGTQREEIFDYLLSRNFCLYAIDDEKCRFYPITKTNLNMIYERHNASYFNVLCVKRNKALSVALFSHSPGMGGAERSLLDLARGLSERGILCTAVIPSEGTLAESFRNSGCAVYVPALTGSINAWWWCQNSSSWSKSRIAVFLATVRNQIAPELEKTSPDVIFSQTIVSPWGEVCAELLNLPHVLSAREYGELDHHLNFLFGFKESIAALYDSSDAVFCITRDVRNVLFDKDDGRKTSVIYSDVHLDAAKEFNAEAWGADWDSGITVGILGTICEGKGQEDLVRAVIALCQQGLKVRCLMAGGISSDAYSEKLDRIIKESGYAEQFRQYPFIDDCRQLMEEIDIMVSCSRKEALGRTLLEAVLSDKPIIYNNAGGPKEIFTSGTHGLAYDAGDYLALADNIVRTVNDKAATRQRIAAAKEYVLHTFNTKRYAGTVADKLWELKGRKPEIDRGNAVIDLINTIPPDDVINELMHELAERDKLLASLPGEENCEIDIFHSNKPDGFVAEKRISRRFKITNRMTDAELPLNTLGSDDTFLRIDLGYRPESFLLKSIRVLDNNNNIIWQWNGAKEEFTRFYDSFFLETEEGLNYISTGNDPQLFCPELPKNSSPAKIIISLKQSASALLIERIVTQQHSLEQLTRNYETLNQERIVTQQHSLEQLTRNYETLNQERIVTQQRSLEQLTRSYETLSQSYNEIINSTFYRVTKPIRKMLEMLKGRRVSSSIFKIKEFDDEELLANSKFFNRSWYLKRYPDVAQAKVTALQHYLNYGWQEDMNPSLLFNTNDYLTRHKDVALSGMNPLVHYLKYGKREGRSIANVKTTPNFFSKIVMWILLLPASLFYYDNIGRGLISIVRGKVFFSILKNNPYILLGKHKNNMFFKILAELPYKFALLIEKNGGIFVPIHTCYRKLIFHENISSDNIDNIDNIKRNIVFVSHDANQTGAPLSGLIICKNLKEMGYNLFIILLDDGHLKDDFESLGQVLTSDNLELESLRSLIADLYRNNYGDVYLNTTLSGYYADLFKKQGYHVVTLINETDSSIEFQNLHEHAKNILTYSDKVVVPSKTVSDSWAKLNYIIPEEKLVVIPQGNYHKAASGKVMNNNLYRKIQPEMTDIANGCYSIRQYVIKLLGLMSDPVRKVS